MNKKAVRFQDLEVWQKAHNLVLETYKITKGFPDDEKFGLVSQMRKAGISIAANIAEGFKKRGLRNKANFYNISQGSLKELKYYIILSKDLGYVQENEKFFSNSDEVGRMPYGLVNSIKSM